MATNDPAQPKNPNSAKTPTQASTGAAPNNQDPSSDISNAIPAPGVLDTTNASGGSAINRPLTTNNKRAASAGTMHSSVKGDNNVSVSISEQWDGVVNDTPSSNTPVAPITERREISRRTTYGPGQNPGIRPGASPINPGPSQVALSPNDLKAPSEAMPQAVWQPGQEGLVSGSSRVITNDFTSYPSAGKTLENSATRANPSADITTRESAGAHTQDPNAETFQDDHRGERTETTGWQPQAVVQKTDVSGRPVNAEVLAVSGTAETSRNTDFKIFAPPSVPADGKKLRSTAIGQSKNQTNSESARLDGSASAQPGIEKSFGSLKGAFYGVNAAYLPTETATESAPLGPATNGNLTLVAKTMPNSIITEGKVLSVAADIRNLSDNVSYPNVTVTVDVIDSNGKRYSVVNTTTNIPTGRAVAVSAPVPADLPLGSLSVVAKITGELNYEILSSRFDTVVAPQSLGVGKFGKGERLPKSVKGAMGLENASTPLLKGRSYPKRTTSQGKVLVATSGNIAGVIKTTQAAKNAGFEPIVYVRINNAVTPVKFDERVKIGEVEVDPLTHEVVFSFNDVTVGHTVEIVVEDANGLSDPSFAWALFATGLTAKSDLSGSCVTNGNYIGGSISTDVTNGLVILENDRTGTRVPVNTDSDGAVIFSTNLPSPSGDGLVSNRFDAVDGDTINVFASESAGAYSKHLFSVPVVTDTGSVVSSETDLKPLRIMPDEKPISEPRFPTYVR